MKTLALPSVYTRVLSHSFSKFIFTSKTCECINIGSVSFSDTLLLSELRKKYSSFIFRDYNIFIEKALQQTICFFWFIENVKTTFELSFLVNKNKPNNSDIDLLYLFQNTSECKIESIRKVDKKTFTIKNILSSKEMRHTRKKFSIK
jgi:hypothetical protein